MNIFVKAFLKICFRKKTELLYQVNDPLFV
jgi:hypothetical protein